MPWWAFVLAALVGVSLAVNVMVVKWAYKFADNMFNL